MCIYLGELPELNYDSADHIVPAGLGGIQKLPLEYVSREFNNQSSKYEKALMRHSILSFPRQILGPGKRGSLNPNNATKSSVAVFREHNRGTFSLGYVQMGKQFEIPQIILNSQRGEFTVNMSKEISDAELQAFKQKLNQFDTLRIKMIKFSDLGTDIFLFGIKLNLEDNVDCFIASGDGKRNPFNARVLSEISETFENRNSFSGSISSQIVVHQNASIDDEYYKCCAKIGFNCLAHLRGKEFVLQEHFNPLRNWIVNGGENNFVGIFPNDNPIIKSIFPQDSHQVIITKIKNTLIADVCFYNHFHSLVRLTENFLEPFPLNGFICDWKEKREFDYYNYMYRNHT